MIYNFRIDRTIQKELLNRIRQLSLLSQGWGGGKDQNLDLNKEEFVSEVKQCYQLASTRVPTNLTTIRQFRDNDILIVPHLPTNGKFMVMFVNGDFPNCYEYYQDDELHANHRIKIKKTFGENGSLDIHNYNVSSWYAKLQWMRLPVINIAQFRENFEELIRSLQKDPNKKFEQSELSDYLENLKQKLIEELKSELLKINPSKSSISFEAICAMVFEEYGYKIKDRNIFDGKGADTDLLVSTGQLLLNPFFNDEKEIHVQIKKHSGKTNEHAIKQILNEIQDNPLKEGIVISLADGFTEEAAKLANDNGILLIDGNKFCEILISKITESS